MVSFQEIVRTEFERRLQREHIYNPVYGITNRENKIVRIRTTLTPLLAGNRFRWLQGNPGTSLLLEQLRSFPVHKHDDGPDALEMGMRGLNHLLEHGVGEVRDNVADNRRGDLQSWDVPLGAMVHNEQSVFG
jgi:hypothetical protein